MKILVISLLGSAVIYLGFQGDSNTGPGENLHVQQVSLDSIFDVEAAIAEISESISGRENEPAEEVFENIEIMKGFPAGRVPLIMQMAFNNSLGVDCTHCHNPDDWSSDEKDTKKVTREMWKMVGTINAQLLANIEYLSSEQPAINCTTCHRGELKPALNLR